MASKSKTAKRQIGLRLPERLRQRVEKSSRRRGTSMNSEIVRRLEESFALDDRLGGPAVAGMLEAVGVTMKSAGEAGRFLAKHETAKDQSWISIPYAFDQALKAAVAVLKAHRPPGEIVVPNWDSAKVTGDPVIAKGALRRIVENLGQFTAEKTIAALKKGGENE